MERAPLYLGEPDRDDVDASAALWNEYRKDGAPERETFQMFMMMVADPEAVMARATELRAASE